ncbi:MAG: DUF3293 domain-containing protein [Wenzhouxiangella sp.]|nr:MAG: DUF3293 domain-containing protein [Wenzhouxiangella sp.]
MISTVERSLDEKLLRAFLNTQYLVNAGTEQLCIRVGQTHPTLDHYLGQRHWAIITASNPAASRLSDDENHARNRRLARIVESAGLDTLPATNRATDSSWPDEHGLLLIAPDGDWLADQARLFEQYGLVSGQPRQPAQLWLFTPCPAAQKYAWVREMDA